MAKKTSAKRDEETTNKRRGNKGSYKGKPMNRKPSGIKKDKDGEYKGSPANDPKYYQNNPILTALSAAVPINPVLGSKELWHKDMVLSGDVVSPLVYRGHAIPGAMGISLIPAFGSDMDASTAATASFNRLCANLYSILVRDKSGTAPFDQAAIGHYLACMRSAYILVHDLRRYLSLVSFYKADNKYFPKGILYAMGRGTATLSSSELDAAMWKLNELVRFLNTKFVPKMSVFQRDFDLYSRLYADSDTDFAQFYTFIPRGYYLWDDPNNKAVFTALGTSSPKLPGTLAEITTLVDGVIASIQNSDIFNIITSWMRHVYSPGDSWQLSEMGFGEAPIFMYDEYILAQIENSKAVDVYYSNFPGLDIVQSGSNNYLEYDNLNTGLSASADASMVTCSANPVFNFHVTNPSEDLKLESSRLIVCADEEVWDASGNYLKAQGSGFTFSDQIPVGYLIAEYDSYTDSFQTKRFWSCRFNFAGSDYSDTYKDILPLITMFKKHPMYWIGKANKDANGKIDEIGVAPVGEIDTVGSMEKDAFKRLSYTCTYSLFSIPGITV